MTPQRIQLKRTKGWRKPEGCVVVSRPTKWGNPYRIQEDPRRGWMVYDWSGVVDDGLTKTEAHTLAVNLFARCLERTDDELWDSLSPYRQGWFTGLSVELPTLAGKDLACWCPLSQACHADVLIELANP